MVFERMNLLGNKFDKLEVIGSAPDRITKSGAHVVYWKCRESGNPIKPNALRMRLERGMTIDEALDKPPKSYQYKVPKTSFR